MSELASWIAAEGLSKAAAARRLGISAPHLHNILSGHRKPSLERAFDIERITGRKVKAKSFFPR